MRQEDSNELPKIVAQVIGYDNAKKIFDMMDGNEVQSDWKGALNVKYTYGGPLKNNQLVIHNHLYKNWNDLIAVVNLEYN